MDYIITNKENELIFSNINNNAKLKQLISCTKEIETVKCVISSFNVKQGFCATDKYHLYLSVTKDNTTNKIFKHYIFLFKSIVDGIICNIELLQDKEYQKTRRLKHNLINHNTNILQELYKLFSQEKFKSGANHIDLIQDQISLDTRKSAFTFLKILKYSNLMKAEFDVYDMINKSEPYLDFFGHQIHKVITLTLNPFWLDLIEKNVRITIQPFTEIVSIDYKTISVALSHIFDNTAKYILPNSEFKINFSKDVVNITIEFNMISIKVNEKEVEDIFLENISGYWTTKENLSGDGIGMYMVDKLVKLNHGSTILKINQNPEENIVYNDIPYENNIISLKLQRA